MYSDSVKHIFGTRLGKGVRKRLPNCVTQIIREICPDKEYTGFIPSINVINKTRKPINSIVYLFYLN